MVPGDIPVSLTEAQSQFAAEFVTVVISAAALALVVLRSPGGVGLRRLMLQVISAAALLALVVAAFLHGSLLLTSSSGIKVLAVVRLAGAALLVPVLPKWWASRMVRNPFAAWMLRGGLVLWTGAGAAELASASTWTVDGFLVSGAVVIGVALLALTRRSIALRVAASSALALLLVVLVLSLALSAVISSSVQKDGLNRLSARMNVELDQATKGTTTAVVTIAKLVGVGLDTNTLVVALAAAPTPKDESLFAQELDYADTLLSKLQQTSQVAYTTRSGILIQPRQSVAPPVAYALVTDHSLAPPSCSAGTQGIFVERGKVLAAASYPVCTKSGTSFETLGTLFVLEPLGDQYLQGRLGVDPSVSLTMASGGAVVAAAGGQLTGPALAHALDLDRANQAVTDALGDRYVSVAPVPTVNRQPLLLILSTPATTVLSTRTRLDRTLFLIALGGTLLALGLAIFTGDRITSGVRRLTGVATSIQGGDTTTRAEMQGDDEVAALGSAFDSMLDSLSEQTSALQSGADEQTRLRNRIEAVIAGMSDALIAVDQFGRITDFNRAAEVLTGESAATAIGQDAAAVVRIIGEDGRPLEHQLFQLTEKPRAVLGELHGSNASRIPVAASAGGLLGPEGELVGTVLVFRDLRREQEVERMKTEFLSRVGHELRTPLTGIMGYTEILLRREVSEDRSRLWHEEILVSARRLLRIVEMLEFFASTGAGRMVIRPEMVDLRVLVGAVATSWAERKPDNISIRRRVARNVPPVLVDPRWLSLAVDELVDNAVKFSPDGGPVLLEVAVADSDGRNGKSPRHQMVEISVRDRGMGMTAAEYELVFGDFVQADSSDTRRFGGLGLGLSVVNRVVEDHGGEIACRSAPGRGTTFTVRIPAAPARASDGEAKRRKRSPTGTHPGP